jgi:glycosyltransferase involved in cell wall biosynthesis
MHLVAYLEATAFGGAESVLRAALGAAVAEHRVTVVAPYGSVARQVASIDPRIAVVMSPPIEGKFDVRSAWALRRLLRSLRPDVVHVNLTDMAACLAATAVVASLHDVGLVVVEHAAHPPQTAFQRAAKRLSERRIDVHVAVSHSLAALVAAASGRALDRITVIPNGADEVPPYPHPADPSGVLRLGVVTRLTRDKGVDMLLDAVAAMDAVEVRIAGDGPAYAELVARVDELGLTESVRFLGWLDDPTVVYGEVDVIVHPSRADIMPMSVIEAMHHGLPVAATNVGGIPDLIDSGVDGLLFPCDDVAACIATLEVLRSPVERERLGSAGRARAVRSYSAAAQRAKFLTAYEVARAAAHRRRRAKPAAGGSR